MSDAVSRPEFERVADRVDKLETKSHEGMTTLHKRLDEMKDTQHEDQLAVQKGMDHMGKSMALMANSMKMLEKLDKDDPEEDQGHWGKHKTKYQVGGGIGGGYVVLEIVKGVWNALTS